MPIYALCSRLARVTHRPGGSCLSVVAGQSPRGRCCWSQCNDGRTWVKFGDPYFSDVLWQSKEESSVAAFFLHIVGANAPVHLVEEEAQGVVAAADAFAEGDVAGLGGWWLPPGHDLDLANIQYFAISLKRSDLPAWFCHDNDGKQVPSLQSCICALEALAQLVLLDVRLSAGEVKASLGRICVRQQCDNFGVVCSTSKGLSMRRPFVLRAPSICSVVHARAC